MSTIANLHSLFNRPWYIHDEYAQSLYPYLFNILNGKFDEAKIEQSPIVYLNFDDDGNYNESEEPENEVSIAVLNIKQPILKYSQWCGPRGTHEMISIMEDWKGNSNIQAILLDIDSGGGQAAGTPEFAHYLKNYTKPVAVYSDGLLCSAAYYIAAATDHITVNPHADFIGSIGTMVEIIDLTGIIEKEGGKVHTVNATKSTEKNKEFYELLKGNYAPYRQTILDPITEKFHKDIKSFRPEVNEAVFKGAIYNPDNALNMNLVDELGTKQDAIDKLIQTVNNNSNMSDTKQANAYDTLQSVLQLDDLKLSTNKIIGGTKGLFLNEEQLAVVETALQNGAQAEQTLQDNATQEADATANLEALETSIADTAKKAGIEQTEESTTETNLASLLDKAEKYNTSSAAHPTHVHADKDPDDGQEGDSMSIYNSLIGKS